jgi:transcriptional regulator with XRE-family HTH domain
MNNVSKILLEQRKKKGMSLKGVAEATGLTDTVIFRIEAGEIKEPSPNALKVLCNFYDFPVLEIYKKLGWIGEEDLSIYKKCFDGVDNLSDEERNHVQEEISFLVSRKD